MNRGKEREVKRKQGQGVKRRSVLKREDRQIDKQKERREEKRREGRKEEDRTDGRNGRTEGKQEEGSEERKETAQTIACNVPLTLSLPCLSAQMKHKNCKIMNSVQQQREHYHQKVLIESFHLSGHTFRFRWAVQDLGVFMVQSNSPLAVEGLTYRLLFYRSA